MSQPLHKKPFSIIGADPGKSGAIACVQFYADHVSLEYIRLDIVSRKPAVFFTDIMKVIQNWRETSMIVGVALEQPFALPKQGAVLSYGRYFGHLEMVLSVACQIDPDMYYPSQWQPLVMPRFKDVHAKELASFLFKQLFRLPETVIEHDGVVDATCIALAHAVKLEMISKRFINWNLFAQEKGISYDEKKPRRSRTPSKQRMENY